MSALRHSHAKQDELVYILEGEPVLITDAGETPMQPGDCAGFKCGTGDAHHLVNRGARDVVYLEIGDRTPGDAWFIPTTISRRDCMTAGGASSTRTAAPTDRVGQRLIL